MGAFVAGCRRGAAGAASHTLIWWLWPSGMPHSGGGCRRRDGSALLAADGMAAGNSTSPAPWCGLQAVSLLFCVVAGGGLIFFLQIYPLVSTVGLCCSCAHLVLRRR
ncbi:unnamed protein product [Urochloa humidicola]